MVGMWTSTKTHLHYGSSGSRGFGCLSASDGCVGGVDILGLGGEKVEELQHLKGNPAGSAQP